MGLEAQDRAGEYGNGMSSWRYSLLDYRLVDRSWAFSSRHARGNHYVPSVITVSCVRIIARLLGAGGQSTLGYISVQESISSKEKLQRRPVSVIGLAYRNARQ
jgi:hypothetical protein